MVKREFTFPSADGKTAIHAVEWLGAPSRPANRPRRFGIRAAVRGLRRVSDGAWLCRGGQRPFGPRPVSL